ncbi:MAG TPA: hypothetical protein VJJ82_02985 [Candidatus Nanoarchaeia archaeon]|nr:hypothetical protein [Candidatus Nanoarchaeia archaeon]
MRNGWIYLGLLAASFCCGRYSVHIPKVQEAYAPSDRNNDGKLDLKIVFSDKSTIILYRAGGHDANPLYQITPLPPTWTALEDNLKSTRR